HRPLDPRHALMVHILRSAPVYRDAVRMDAWEGAYQDAGGDDESSPLDGWLDSIFALGRLNMYTAFDQGRTEERYQQLVARFHDARIPISGTPDLSQW
ncbi:MAG TPA: hypothetical protein VFG20_16535, partial [Planctomycetaceae bacterium]|nr:hypothetical protein [Planctomycetaceae bacterium]